MLRISTIRAVFRSTIYLFLILILFTVLHIVHDPSSLIESTRESFETLGRIPENQLSLRDFGNWRGWWYGYGRGVSKEVKNNRLMSVKECEQTFPGYDTEVREAIARGPFVLTKVANEFLGPSLQGRIKDGKLYIISAERDLSQAAQQYRTAILHQLHRAIVTTPSSEPLPDTIFSFSVIDNPRPNAWSFARSDDFITNPNQWLMPHFSFWSWPYPFIQALDIALEKINNIEAQYSNDGPSLVPLNTITQIEKGETSTGTGSTIALSWHNKIDKLVWRGTTWFNPISNTDLRKSLLRATENKVWADVKALHWNGNPGETKAENLLQIEDFCRYKYIVYTEGITYSGRLPFHQACKSVILTTGIGFLQHTTWLARPIWSGDLLSGNTTHRGRETGDELWPISYQPSEANVIFVKWDWSDLEETILYLQNNPEIAERIAGNQREVMVEKGYLSPAAEVCYWRALVRGWSEMVRPDESWDDELGMRWEGFSITGKSKW